MIDNRSVGCNWLSIMKLQPIPDPNIDINFYFHWFRMLIYVYLYDFRFDFLSGEKKNYHWKHVTIQKECDSWDNMEYIP